MVYKVEQLHSIEFIPLGQRGENLATTVEIDVSAWQERWPKAGFSVIVSRPNENVPYVAVATVKGSILSWPITDVDTALVGIGNIEIQAVSGSVLKKSTVVRTKVCACLDGDEEPGDVPLPPADSVLEQMLKVNAYVQQAASDVESIKEDIEERAAELDGLKDEIIAPLNASLITCDASGEMVSITDGADGVPVQSLITHVEPVETGEGEKSPDNPWTIIGWDEASVTVTGAGKNLFGGEALADRFAAVVTVTRDDEARTISFYASSMSGKVFFTQFKPNTQYTLILYGSNGTAVTNLHIRYTDGSVDTPKFAASGEASYAVFVTDAGKSVEALRGSYSNGRTTLYYDRCGIFEGVLTEADFAEYQGQTLTAILPETLYGFDKNWTTGLVTVTHGVMVFDGTETISRHPSADNFKNTTSFYVSIPDAKLGQNTSISSHFVQTGTGNSAWNLNAVSGLLTDYTEYRRKYFTWGGVGQTLAEFKAWLAEQYAAGTPVTLVYELDTPYTIQLTPQQLATLKGVNNIWSDAGTTEVVYTIDTKTYIDRAEEKIQALSAVVAPSIFVDASGDMVTITDGAAMPVVSLITHVEPKQKGSGVPSLNNVRPISGWDSVSASRTRKNILPFLDLSGERNGVTFTGNGDGTYTVDGTADKDAFYRSNTMPITLGVLPAGQYTISVTPASAAALVRGRVTNKTSSTSVGTTDSTTGIKTFTTDGVSEYAFGFYVPNGKTVENLTVSFQIEPGVNATDHELYQGETLTAKLPETVYGLDKNWTTGLATVTEAVIVYDGTEAWSAGSLQNTVRLAKPKNAESAVCCSHYKVAPMSSAYDSINIVSFVNFHDSINTVDVATWKAFLAEQAAAGTPVTVVYKLAEPYTIQLTPQQMETLKGTNNIWSNAGQTAVTYAADTKMYADGKDSTSLIGAAEPGMVATRNYAIGDFIVAGNSLYKATAAIATGEVITPGTNCTATSVVEQLAAIYNLLNA